MHFPCTPKRINFNVYDYHYSAVVRFFVSLARGEAHWRWAEGGDADSNRSRTKGFVKEIFASIYSNTFSFYFIEHAHTHTRIWVERIENRKNRKRTKEKLCTVNHMRLTLCAQCLLCVSVCVCAFVRLQKLTGEKGYVDYCVLASTYFTYVHLLVHIQAGSRSHSHTIAIFKLIIEAHAYNAKNVFRHFPPFGFSFHLCACVSYVTGATKDGSAGDTFCCGENKTPKSSWNAQNENTH